MSHILTQRARYAYAVSRLISELSINNLSHGQRLCSFIIPVGRLQHTSDMYMYLCHCNTYYTLLRQHFICGVLFAIVAATYRRILPLIAHRVISAHGLGSPFSHFSHRRSVAPLNGAAAPGVVWSSMPSTFV